jgi:hypothetical protein
MAIFQAGPSCPTFDTCDPAGRELIVATDLSSADEAGRTEAVRVSEQAGRPVLADDAADMAAESCFACMVFSRAFARHSAAVNICVPSFVLRDLTVRIENEYGPKTDRWPSQSISHGNIRKHAPSCFEDPGCDPTTG